jgi:hypothetical protein
MRLIGELRDRYEKTCLHIHAVFIGEGLQVDEKTGYPENWSEPPEKSALALIEALLAERQLPFHSHYGVTGSMRWS